MKKLEKFFFNHRFFFYGFATSIALALLITNPILHFAIYCIITPFVFLADEKLVKEVR